MLLPVPHYCVALTVVVQGHHHGRAAVAVDVDGDGIPDYVVSGADRDGDGIPDALQVMTAPCLLKAFVTIKFTCLSV